MIRVNTCFPRTKIEKPNMTLSGAYGPMEISNM